MTAAFIGVFGALTGTILGALLTQGLQRRNAAFTKVHDARLDAYRTFAAAVMDYRRALIDRWYVDNAGRPLSQTENVYAARSTVWAAYFQVVLVAGDPRIVELAVRARDKTHAVKYANAPDEIDAAGEESRLAVGHFMEVARGEVSPGRARLGGSPA
jgi:hypothetical protein